MVRHHSFIFMLWCVCSLMYGQGKPVTYLFVGTYTDGRPGDGIFIYQFNSKTGNLTLASTFGPITNPSFLTLSPNGRFLYACTDTRLPDPGTITAFKLDSIHGSITLLNHQSSGGENPVYVSVHKSNRYVIAANYTGGSVASFHTNEDGSLEPSLQVIPFTGNSVNAERQEKAHIHSAVFSPDHDFVFLPDLGTDKIRIFSFREDIDPLVPGLSEQKTLPGSGPRHFAFHPNGKFAYCIEELSGMVSAYTYSNGKLAPFQRVMSCAKEEEVYRSADIHVSPDGRFLYASNRGYENSITIFSINAVSGELKIVDHQSTYGDHPRNFTIDPTGHFLLVANMVSNNIVIFRRNLKTGLLSRTKQEIKIPAPSCLQMRTYRKL